MGRQPASDAIMFLYEALAGVYLMISGRPTSREESKGPKRPLAEINLAYRSIGTHHTVFVSLRGSIITRSVASGGVSRACQIKLRFRSGEQAPQQQGD